MFEIKDFQTEFCFFGSRLDLIGKSQSSQKRNGHKYEKHQKDVCVGYRHSSFVYELLHRSYI